MKILQVGAELFHADKRTDRYAEANSRFSQIGERASKIFVGRNYAYGLYYGRSTAMYWGPR